ncbi:MAG: hypothetical protein U0795_23470 [Pirellulales bacterium]
MGFFQSKKRQSREPNETARLTPNVEAVLWTGKSETGQLSVAFGLNRVDEQGNQRRTFRPEHLPQLAEAIAVLAISLGQAKGIDRVVGEELSELGRAIGKAMEVQKANGPATTIADDASDKLLG